MAIEYELRFRTREGSQRGAAVRNFVHLEYDLVVNDAGLLIFELPSDHVALNGIDWDHQVDVRRRDVANDIAWYTEFYGLYVDRELYADENGNSMHRGICVGSNDWLARAVIAYPANTANRTVFTNTPVETIAKTLVTYNATSAGTTGDGRVSNVDAWGANISVQADAANGPSKDWRCAHESLLANLQDLALIGGGDFNVVRTGDQAWQFRWYDGQLGTDRSGTMTFALQYNNMQSPRLTLNRYAERTKAIVGGQAEEAAREFVVRTGANYQALYNSREFFVDARRYSTTAGYQAAGDTKLEELRSRNRLSFVAKDSAARRYGRDYFVGDKTAAYWEGITATQQIRSATVIVTAGRERIETINLGIRDV